MDANVAARSVLAGELLAALREQGFRIGVQQFMLAERVLESLEPAATPEQVRDRLCPLVAKTAQEQQRFHDVFADFLPLLAGAPAREPTSLSEPRDVDPRRRKRRAGWLVLIAAGLLAMGLFGWAIVNGGGKVQAPVVISEGDDKAPAVSTPAGEPARLLEPIPPPVPAPRQTFVQQQARHIRLGATLVPLLALGLLILYRLLGLRPGVVRVQSPRSPFAFLVPSRSERSLPYAGEALLSAARLARDRRRGETVRFAVRPTVQATIAAAGHPTVRLFPGTRASEYLVLVERRSARDHQARLFDGLVARLQSEGVHAVRYFFDADPRICYAERSETGVLLADLQREYPLHRLVIVSDGEPMLHSVSGELLPWTTALHDWSERVLLTPEPPSLWGVREVVLAEHFLVLPATLHGVHAMVEFLSGATDAEWETWWERHEHGSDEPLPGRITADSLRAYLGPDAFRLLCACAAYPELHWNLTLYLASSGAAGSQQMGEEALIRLVRVPWLRSGSIPDPERLRLLQSLSPGDHREVRSAIIRLLDRIAADAPASVLDRLGFDKRVQQLFLHQDSRAGRRAAIREAKRLPRGLLLQDVAVVRLLERLSASRLAMVLPRRFHRLLFNDGLAAFGLRLRVLAAVTAFLASSAFVGLVPLEQPPAARLSFPLLSLTLAPGAGLDVGLRLVDGSGRLAPDTALAWRSVDPSVARVEGRGSVTAIRVGATVIRGSAREGEGSFAVQVSDQMPAPVVARVATRELRGDSIGRLSPVLPIGPADSVRWISCNPAVAYPEGRDVVRGIAEGTTPVVGIARGGLEVGELKVLRAREPRSPRDILRAQLARPLSATQARALPGSGVSSVLDEKARLLMANPRARVRVVASVPSPDSARLAAGVREYLETQGVDRRQLAVATVPSCGGLIPELAGSGDPGGHVFFVLLPEANADTAADTTTTKVSAALSGDYEGQWRNSEAVEFRFHLQLRPARGGGVRGHINWTLAGAGARNDLAARLGESGTEYVEGVLDSRTDTLRLHGTSVTSTLVVPDSYSLHIPGNRATFSGRTRTSRGDWSARMSGSAVSRTAAPSPAAGCEQLAIAAGDTVLAPGQRIRLSASFRSRSPTPTLRWTSSAPRVAQVSAEGVLTGKALGVASIRVECGTMRSELSVRVSTSAGATVRELVNGARVDRRITGVVLHHTGQPGAREYRGVATFRALQRYFTEEENFSGFPYHYAVAPSGEIFEGRPLGEPGAHVRGHNAETVGVVLILDGMSEDPTTAQSAAVGELLRALFERFGIDPEDNFAPGHGLHRELDSSTGKTRDCPGSRITREVVMRWLASSPRS